jgi:hypothetical protein
METLSLRHSAGDQYRPVRDTPAYRKGNTDAGSTWRTKSVKVFGLQKMRNVQIPNSSALVCVASPSSTDRRLTNLTK